jgi:hypothetical protein
MPEPHSLLLVLLLVLVFLSIILNIRRILHFLRRLSRRDRLRADRDARHGLPQVLPESPREQWIIWSRVVRGALAERFGPAWGAKTTEEIAAEPALVDLLGPERAGTLVRALGEADRAKFADPSSPDLPTPLPYLELIAALAPAPESEAGARSTIKGR